MKSKMLLAVAAASMAATAAVAAPPRVFLLDAGRTDNSEIALGQLAESRGGSDMARDLGRMLQSDHRASQAAAAPLLRRYRLAPPADILPAARAEMRRLRGLSGRAFDRELANFNVNAHSAAIVQFQAQARTGDRWTADFARAQLPALRHHLQAARDLLRSTR
ncbi:MAG: putative rane protein [Sphingomonadales bacterium]|jgi:putative membrane protein|nr:putative rane protein [Sphingomonadales bacterium]